MASKRANGEGAVAQRANGLWEARFSYEDADTGKTRRLSSYGKTQKEARDKMRAKRDRVDAGQPSSDAKISLSEFIERWITTTLRASDRKESTKSTYSQLARSHLQRGAIGAISLDRLRAPDVEALILVMRDEGLAASTIRQTFTIFRAILDAAVRDGLLARNVAALVKRPGVVRTEARALSPAEVGLLFEELAGSRYEPVMQLLLRTGLRRGEGLALRWADVDLVENVIRVRGTLGRVNGALSITEPKTATSRRSVKMGAVLVELLHERERVQAADRLLAEDLWTETGLVFTTETGAPHDPRNALRALSTAALRAKLGVVGVHTLRHTAASLMLSAKVPLKEVSVMLGHSSVSITGDIYGHVTPEGQQTAADVLAAALA
jgi:integrase